MTGTAGRPCTQALDISPVIKCPLSRLTFRYSCLKMELYQTTSLLVALHLLFLPSLLCICMSSFSIVFLGSCAVGLSGP